VGTRDGDFVDGGAALIVKPYTDDEWRQVRTAWWWHTIGMWCIPMYAPIALTIWQAPSRQTRTRRFVWAMLMWLSASLLVGLPAMLVFSRRWYWMHRTGTAPEDVGVGFKQPNGSDGYLPWVAVGGCALADRITRRPEAPPPALGEPWASLLSDAARAVSRIERAVARSEGPATKPMVAALNEATAAVVAAHRVANQASDADAALADMGLDRVRTRLAELEASTSPDVDATKRSLGEQVAAGDRMRAYVTRLEQQVERLVAQLGEAAARADELAMCPPDQVELPAGMTDAVDRLAAIRGALESVEGYKPS
jgi:hypothetical protein